MTGPPLFDINEVWLTAIALLEVEPTDDAAVAAIIGYDIDMHTVGTLPGVMKELFAMLAREVDPAIVSGVLNAARARALAGEFRLPRRTTDDRSAVHRPAGGVGH